MTSTNAPATVVGAFLHRRRDRPPWTRGGHEQRQIGVEVAADSGFWQPILTLGLGFGGVAVGAVLTASFQHRQWLRDARRSSYGELLLALDRATDAGNSYVHSLRSYAEALIDGDDDEQGALRQLASMKVAADNWQRWRDADAVLDRTRTAFELVVARQTQPTALLATLGSSRALGAWYWNLENPTDAAAAIEACDSWDSQSQRRQAARKRLVERARLDLGVDRPSPRRRWNRAKQRLGRPFAWLRSQPWRRQS